MLNYMRHALTNIYCRLLGDLALTAATVGVADKPSAPCETIKSLIPQGFTPSR
jgi:hypothetical protein